MTAAAPRSLPSKNSTRPLIPQAASRERQGRNVTDNDHPDVGDIGKFDPVLTQRLMAVMRPALKTYFRSEVHGLKSFPPGGALVVGNHSGGMFPMDVPIFSVHFYEEFGYDRPVYTLSHDILMTGPTGEFFRRTGYIRANRENAAQALRSGGVVIVFPGGDYDAYRPTLSENVIDFNGRKGYVRTAIEAGVPVVPAVSIGGQETQLYLSRGTWLAERLGVKRLLRSAILPLSFGFPFGFSAVIPPNLPLPTKIVTQVLEPIDIATQFGDDPDIDEVDEHVRSVMQQALKDLAGKRRFPILG
jgi:1-acyl-sn-glycerol-3-phosphate acyltransferase